MKINELKSKAITLPTVQQQNIKGGTNDSSTASDIIIIEDINTI